MPSIYVVTISSRHGGERDTWLYTDIQPARKRAANLIMEVIDSADTCDRHLAAHTADFKEDYEGVIAQWYELEYLYETCISLDCVDVNYSGEEVARVEDLSTGLVHSALVLPLSTKNPGVASCGRLFLLENTAARSESDEFFVAYVTRHGARAVTCMTCSAA